MGKYYGLPRRAHRQLWLCNRNRKILRRRTRVRKKRTRLRAVEMVQNSYTENSVWIDRRRLTIELPECLDFEENFEETASHFAIVREAVSRNIRINLLKFDKIRFISPAAALVMASEIDVWNSKVGGVLRAHTHLWHPDISRLLCQMGFFGLLQKKAPEFPSSKHTTFLPFRRGSTSLMNKGEVARSLRIDIENLVGFPIKRLFLYEGLSEAITNVGQHAYSKKERNPLHCFWLSASYDAQVRRLVVAFYDQGVGIPVTLPQHQDFQMIHVLFRSWNDAAKIAGAMTLGKTSTNRSERGKGLSNLEEFARVHQDGALSVYSLRGRYRMTMANTSNDQQEAKETLTDFQNSIGGTLIEWSVTL